MKKKLFTAIITLATITLTSCQSVPASETEKIFTDGYEITSIELRKPVHSIHLQTEPDIIRKRAEMKFRSFQM